MVVGSGRGGDLDSRFVLGYGVGPLAFKLDMKLAQFRANCARGYELCDVKGYFQLRPLNVYIAGSLGAPALFCHNF